MTNQSNTDAQLTDWRLYPQALQMASDLRHYPYSCHRNLTHQQQVHYCPDPCTYFGYEGRWALQAGAEKRGAQAQAEVLSIN